MIDGFKGFDSSMGKNQQRYSIADVRMAMDEVGPSIAAISRRLDCATGTVYSYLKRFPELMTRFEALKGGQVESQPQFPYELFEKAIKGSRGIKAAIVQRVGCTRPTLENAIQRWPDLGVMIEDERSSIVDFAESKLLKALDADDMRAIVFTLETLGKNRGWSKRTEVTGRDGGALLDIPPDLIRQIEAMGLNLVEVLRNFVAMTPPEAG